MRPDPHIGDDELIMAIDGELEEPRSRAVAGHLRHCWECRARRDRLEKAIAGFMEIHSATADLLQPSPAAGPTARLRAMLASEAPQATRFSSNFIRSRARRALVAGIAAALFLSLAAAWISRERPDVAGPLPDTSLTPGAVRFVSKHHVCGLAPADEGRLVPAELAHRVFAQYRISNPRPRAYEVDYLISPALGGATALQNLWPVPYSDGVWTSRVKDALEDHLRTLVCAGKLDLETAQQELAANWIAAYQKHFRTRTPVAEHARFVKDSPWE